MDIRILMIGDDPCYIEADIRLLRDKGFRVYTSFNHENIAETIQEIKPHVIFFNLKHCNTDSDSKHNLDINAVWSKASVIYTIEEDGTYMVAQSIPKINGKRIVLADSLIAAVKTALGNISYTPKAALQSMPRIIHLHRISA